jgi:hypothetical protein
MRLRSLLAGAAVMVGALSISVPAFASTTSGHPNWQQSWQAPKGDNGGGDGGMCPQDNRWNQGHETDGNCCQDQFPWLTGDKGGNKDIMPWRDTCAFPKPPVCHEVTTWTETWGWSRDHHRVPQWHQEHSQKCDNQGGGNWNQGQGGDGGYGGGNGGSCTVIAKNDNGAYDTTSVVTNGEKLTYGSKTYTVGDVTDVSGTYYFTLSPSTGLPNQSSYNFTCPSVA